MYNPEYIISRCLSRILFIQYIINKSLLYDIDIENTINVMNEHQNTTGFLTLNSNHNTNITNDNINFHDYDIEFYRRLISCFDMNYIHIFTVVKETTKLIYLDEISQAIVISGVVEFLIRSNTKHIIRDYLKIADLYDISSRLIHGILHDIFLLLKLYRFIMLILLYTYSEENNI